MSDNSKIEWTDATWNPITGCSVVSPGCTNCYAMRLAGTRLQHHPSRAGLTKDSKAGPVWTGEVRLNEDWLTQPLRWSKPRHVFVCAHGDLFHEAVPDDWIDRVFAVMALAPQHQFQVLTKRAERMREYVSRARDRVYDLVMDAAINGVADVILIANPAWADRAPPGRQVVLGDWPLANVWLGVSVEDQTRANERIPHLLGTPAAVRFVSAEPLLGPVDMGFALPGPRVGGKPCIHWVIVGGESGPNARPMNADWARSLRDQCQDAGVAFFMKQMARKAPIPPDLMVREWPK